jgi:hypothetical protein
VIGDGPRRPPGIEAASRFEVEKARLKEGDMRTSTLVMALVLGLRGLSLADDLCISLNGTNTIVGKNFKVPKKNTCRPFVGFEQGNGFYTATVTGAACVASDGTAMGLDLVLTHPGVRAGLMFLAQLDQRIAINLSLPLVDGAQQSEASVYQTTFNEFLPPSLDAEQLSGVQALPCVPSKQDIPRPISHFP